MSDETPDTQPAPERHAVIPTIQLVYDFPLRPNFLVQLVIPSTLTTVEARRLTAFLLSLCQDWTPDGASKEQAAEAEHCHGCDKVLTPTDGLHYVVDQGRSRRVCPGCYEAWTRERYATTPVALSGKS